MSFQFLSDLHLEHRHTLPPLRRHAPHLILAGDVGRPTSPLYKELLERASELFDHVFLVAGNHEFYGTTLSEGRETIAAACTPLPNVHFLDNCTFSSDCLPVHVFGGTMWSDVDGAEEGRVVQEVSDYRCILGFSPQTSRNEFWKFVDVLDAELKEKADKPFVVVSHHLPLRSLVHPRYLSSGINSAFASDNPLATSPRIAAWVFGHTHTPCSSPPFHCSPLGYPGERGGATTDAVFCVGTEGEAR